MKIFQFLMYYFDLHLRVLFGFYHTSYPLNINWRWKYWKKKYEREHNRRVS